MRLICPNCDAQYEVDDAVIPENGRDVQCSSCGHTWFQPGAFTPDEDLEPAYTEEVQPPEQDVFPQEPAEADAAIIEALEEEEFFQFPDHDHDDEDEPEEEEDSPPQHAGTAPASTVLDESVLDVLREEAERETRARRAEAQRETLESQPDLGLEAGAAAGAGGFRSGLQERMARLRGVSPDPQPHTASAGPRRDLLPDIEEINSTLRATSDNLDQGRMPDGPVLENTELPRRRGGFGFGFGFVMLVAALVVALYVFAPKISAVFPPVEPLMAAYVTTADELRTAINSWTSGTVQKLTAALNGLTG